MSYQSPLIKFYAWHVTKDNYLYVFKVKDRFTAVDAVSRILGKFQNVRAVYYVDSSGRSVQIYSSKNK